MWYMGVLALVGCGEKYVIGRLLENNQNIGILINNKIQLFYLYNYIKIRDENGVLVNKRISEGSVGSL